MKNIVILILVVFSLNASAQEHYNYDSVQFIFQCGKYTKHGKRKDPTRKQLNERIELWSRRNK